jgi:hypothetical protein
MPVYAYASKTMNKGGFMLKKLALYIAMMVMLATGVPLLAGAAVNNNPNALTGGKPKPQVTIQFGQPRRRRWRENGRWYTGYRNYGQYRRTQVGWRYRNYPEYYMYGGQRRVRHVRYYYRF